MQADNSTQQPALLAILPIQRQGPWLQACLLCGGGHDLRITQVGDLKDAAAVARKRHFDAALIWHEGSGHETLTLLEQTKHLRLFEGGCIVLGMKPHEGWHVPLFEAGAAVCLDLDQCDPITLVHQMRNTIELIKLRSERGRAEEEAARARRREVDQLDRLMSAQQSLLARLDALHTGETASLGTTRQDSQRTGARSARTEVEPPAVLQLEYIACLKQYTFDASTAASQSIRGLAVKCHSLGLTGRTLMRLHLGALEVTTHGAGSGSLRHILVQADRFLIELLLEHLELSSQTGGSGSNLPVAERSGLVNSPSVAA